jgi:hypothetical protein
MFPSINSVKETIRDLWNLLVSYAKQETIDPLRNLGRYFAFGLGGMALITLGAFFIGLAVLRALQSMTGDAFSGFWSWVPYLVVVLGFTGVIAFVLSRIQRELNHSRGEDL